MSWTKEPPKEPGWYWMRDREKFLLVRRLWMRRDGAWKQTPSIASSKQNLSWCGYEDDPVERWSEPIKEPEEQG